LPTGVTVTDGVLSIAGYTGKTNTFSGASPTFNIYSSNPASNTALANSDYENVGSTAFATAISYASWNESGGGTYNDFTFNANGVAAIVDGICKFSIREAAYDGTGSNPNAYWVSNGSMFVIGLYANETGTTVDPKLVITYTTETVPYVIAYVTRTDLFAGTAR
jgi:hypothetical protein